MSIDRNGVFERALRNQRAVTAEEFAATFGQRPDLLASLQKSDEVIQRRIRKMMEEADEPGGQFLFTLTSLAAPRQAEARTLLDTGKVAAVDGTDALSPLSLLNTDCYAAAVGMMTARQRGVPAVTVTETSTRYLDPARLEQGGDSSLVALCQELEEARAEESWPRTFREFAERRLAMACETRTVFLDGPIFTQNLMSQRAGRELYRELERLPKTFIGVIKDIRSSWPLSRWCGYCLRTGEGFVVGPVKTEMAERFAKHTEIREWVEAMPEDYVRVVYRPASMSFAFECRVRELPLAVALLLEDASPALHHETPLLLETIDAQLRGGFDARAVTRARIGRLQDIDFQLGLELQDERDWR
jgi:hypothetical protein